MATTRYTWPLLMCCVCLSSVILQSTFATKTGAKTEQKAHVKSAEPVLEEQSNQQPPPEPDPAKLKAEIFKVVEQNDLVGVLISKECCTCEECIEAEAVFSVVGPKLRAELGLELLKIVNQPEIEAFYGIKTWPSFLFLRKKRPVLYEGPFDAEVLFDWIKENKEVSTKFIGDGTFEHITQAATGATTGDWLIAFTNSSCTHGMSLLSHLEAVAIKMKYRINIAYVDTEKNVLLKERFKLSRCPSIWYFRQGKMYEYKSHKLTMQALEEFAKGSYKKSKAEPVPPPSSPFTLIYDLGNYYLKGKLVPVTYIVVTILAVYLWTIFVHKQVEAKEEKTE